MTLSTHAALAKDKVVALETINAELVKVLEEAEAFLGLGEMSSEALQKAIDAGLDTERGIGKGKAKITLNIRAALAKAKGATMTLPRLHLTWECLYCGNVWEADHSEPCWDTCSDCGEGCHNVTWRQNPQTEEQDNEH